MPSPSSSTTTTTTATTTDLFPSSSLDDFDFVGQWLDHPTLGPPPRYSTRMTYLATMAMRECLDTLHKDAIRLFHWSTSNEHGLAPRASPSAPLPPPPPLTAEADLLAQFNQVADSVHKRIDPQDFLRIQRAREPYSAAQRQEAEGLRRVAWASLARLRSKMEANWLQKKSKRKMGFAANMVVEPLLRHYWDEEAEATGLAEVQRTAEVEAADYDKHEEDGDKERSSPGKSNSRITAGQHHGPARNDRGIEADVKPVSNPDHPPAAAAPPPTLVSLLLQVLAGLTLAPTVQPD